MNRAALLRRIELLEKQIQPPPPLADRILATATDEQLGAIEVELVTGGSCPVWDALVASYEAGEARP